MKARKAAKVSKREGRETNLRSLSAPCSPISTSARPRPPPAASRTRRRGRCGCGASGRHCAGLLRVELHRDELHRQRRGRRREFDGKPPPAPSTPRTLNGLRGANDHALRCRLADRDANRTAPCSARVRAASAMFAVTATCTTGFAGSVVLMCDSARRSGRAGAFGFSVTST